MALPSRLRQVRVEIAALEKRALGRGVLPFGDPRIDARLGGGLALGVWHEVSGEGAEAETAVCAAAFVALIAGALAEKGAILWVGRRDDLYPPGLATLDFPAERLIQVRGRRESDVLAALEDALGTRGVAAAVAEAETVDLTAGRRLQLACERGGATGFVIRRRLGGVRAPRAAGPAGSLGGSAAASRWRIVPAPSLPPLGEPGLGAPRWRLTLERRRGGGSGAWIVEKTDGAHPLRVVAELADHGLPAAPRLALAG